MYIQNKIKDLFFQEKKVWISVHAIKRARKRKVILPDMLFAVIKGGKIKRFGKNQIKFIKPYKNRVLICIGEDKGYSIIIKTIEWGK